MTHTDQSRAAPAYQDRGWYWVEREGWAYETIIAPAMYKAECDAWYSVEFSGSPTREVKVLEPIRRATTEESSGIELPEPVAHINQNGVIHEAGYGWSSDNYLSGLYTEQQVRALLNRIQG